jgi:aerobic-type carbon monoxide dehydrogenase small subunit (CoxS/CutS family)
MRLELTLNGRTVSDEIEPQELLLDYLRDRRGLTGAKRSCEVQVCGACTVLLNGEPVSACCTLAAEVDGREVLTIEGLASSPEFERLERAFTEHAALQCGFCTPGILLTTRALLDSGELADADGDAIRRALAGNLCRCTGYRGIVEAVEDVAGAAR